MNNHIHDSEDHELSHIIRKIKFVYRLSKDYFLTKDIPRVIKVILKCSDTEAGDLLKKIIQLLYKDNPNTEIIHIDVLAKEVQSRIYKLIPNDSLTDFFTSFYVTLLSKSEEIVFRLKLLRKCEWVTKQNRFSSTIDYILTTITEGELDELEPTEFTKHLVSAKESMKMELFSLAQYSQIESSNQREKDFTVIRSRSKKYTNPFNYSSIHSNASSSGNSQRRRSTNLSTLVSPSIIARLYTQICRIDQVDFNIFDLDEIVGKKATIYVANEILSKFDLVENEMIPPETLTNFIQEIVDHYDRVNALYHNDLHAGDVMQTLFTILIKGNMQEKMQMGQLDTFSALIAALCHDFKHPGQNNIYQINTKSKISLRYNDVSVLENYHLAQSFKVLSNSKSNIFKKFTPEEYRICRKRMIEGILATDMANHQKVLSWIKTNVNTFDIKKGVNFERIITQHQNNLNKLFETQQEIINFLLHTSDISNPAKPDKISENWTRRVYDEFFIQGDFEKGYGLPISTFCNRETTDINKAMIGFISFVVAPTIDVLVNLIPEVGEYRDYCKANLKKYQLNVKREEKRASTNSIINISK